MPIGFIARVGLVKSHDYEKVTDTAVKILDRLMLNTYNIIVEGETTLKQYEQHNESKAVNRYIRIPIKKKSQEIPAAKDEYQMLKVGTTKYDHEAFASRKHFSVLAARYGEYTLLWFSFHPKLSTFLTDFDGVTNTVTVVLSRIMGIEAIYLQANSFNRTDDHFSVYVSGKPRNEKTEKGALTDLKNQYRIDINTVMDTIDNTIAVIYAPFDYGEIKKQKFSHELRRQVFDNKQKEGVITDEELIKKISAEHDDLSKSLELREKQIMRAMSIEPVGSLRFFKLNDAPDDRRTVLKSESVFGTRKKRK
jgi:hypothetical protein